MSHSSSSRGQVGLRCANRSCEFAVTDATYGGYCCKRCHANDVRFQLRCMHTEAHGHKCQQVASQARRAEAIPPDEPAAESSSKAALKLHNQGRLQDLRCASCKAGDASAGPAELPEQSPELPEEVPARRPPQPAAPAALPRGSIGWSIKRKRDAETPPSKRSTAASAGPAEPRTGTEETKAQPKKLPTPRPPRKTKPAVPPGLGLESERRKVETQMELFSAVRRIKRTCRRVLAQSELPVEVASGSEDNEPPPEGYQPSERDHLIWKLCGLRPVAGYEREFAALVDEAEARALESVQKGERRVPELRILERLIPGNLPDADDVEYCPVSKGSGHSFEVDCRTSNPSDTWSAGRMAFIRPSMWLALLQTFWVDASVIRTEMQHSQRQEVVVDAQAATDVDKPRHVRAKQADTVSHGKAGHVKTQKHAKHSKRNKKVEEPASLMRAEPSAGSETKPPNDEESTDDGDEDEGEGNEESSQESTQEGSEDKTPSTEKDDSTGEDTTEDTDSDTQDTSADTDTDSSAAASTEDMKGEEAEEDPGDGTGVATETVQISDSGNRISGTSNASAAVLMSDSESFSSLKAISQANSSNDHSSAATGARIASNLEQGSSESAEVQSSSDADAESLEGLEEGLEEGESDELVRGAAQACVGTMIEKCPSDKSDPCKSSDAGTCVNVFHKCADDKLTQCVT
ncbi:unnamed protein product [Symbiodinium sp. CCMP2456]|nr:unnamed protein product [Symbiodinium sp. CCMP2456]